MDNDIDCCDIITLRIPMYIKLTSTLTFIYTLCRANTGKIRLSLIYGDHSEPIGYAVYAKNRHRSYCRFVV